MQLETSRNINLEPTAINLGPCVINGSGRRSNPVAVPVALGLSIDFFVVDSVRAGTDYISREAGESARDKRTK